MEQKKATRHRPFRYSLPIILILFFLILSGLDWVNAAPGTSKKTTPNNWWEVMAEEEIPSEYYDSILYSEIAPKLREIQLNSNKLIKVEVIGQSAGGRNLFMVTISKPGEEGRFGHYQQLRKMMLRDPEMALSKLDEFESFKIPFFINGSIHGDEYPGTDACIRLIEKLAYEDSPEVQAILDNVILSINVVQNPDGRVLGTRRNSNGVDINRDMITQSQPETRATVQAIRNWNPMVFLDLHGFISPMLIEPCTPPHNPNYEYDLYLTWALELSYAMRDELIATTGESDVIIPYLDWPDGWDDWPPIYAAMYPMLHGAYGHTLETPHEDARGVDAHFAAVWGALKYVAENRKAMVRDQIEVYRRGALDLPQVMIPDELLSQTAWEQYNELTIQDFPTAYIIAKHKPLQHNPVQAAELVNFLIYNGVEVEQAVKEFTVEDKTYPAGSYVIWMDQPKRSLANITLENGMDVSGLEGISFYSPPASWSHPLLWGVTRTVVADTLAVPTRKVHSAKLPKGAVESGQATAYAVLPDTVQGFFGVNSLLADGYTLFRATQPFTDGERQFSSGTIILQPDRQQADLLSKAYMMEVVALDAMPTELLPMKPQKIAIYGDEGLAHHLKTMGFDFTELTATDLNSGTDLSGFDLFAFGNDRWWMYYLNETGVTTILDFIAAGGDFLGLGNGGNSFAEFNSLLDVTMTSVAGNGIARVELAASGHTAGFASSEYAFIYNPYWYTNVPDKYEIIAHFNSEELLVSGYLPGWQASPAAGEAAMIFAENVDNPLQDTTLVGFDPTFRGHPKQTAKLIANAIYSSLE